MLIKGGPNGCRKSPGTTLLSHICAHKWHVQVSFKIFGPMFSLSPFLPTIMVTALGEKAEERNKYVCTDVSQQWSPLIVGESYETDRVNMSLAK